MRFVQGIGELGALVVNNDIRMHRYTAACLRDLAAHMSAYFVSGVGIGDEETFEAFAATDHPRFDEIVWNVPGEDLHGGQLAGPDFSCFYLTVEGWETYPFDECFYPAYCEDVSYHRRLILGGDGRKIFGVNLPFLHKGSATINRTTDEATRFAPKYRSCVETYTRMWGGPPNAERYRVPFEVASVGEGYGTQELFARVRSC
jgi:hypothetical protein